MTDRRTFFRSSLQWSLAGWVAAPNMARMAQASAPDAMKAGAAPDEEALWASVRRQFLLPPRPAYLNNGSLGPMPEPVVQARCANTRALAASPGDYRQQRERESVRDALAAFVGADADDIAITANTTEGMNLFAHGLDWQAGDEVIISTQEHPGGSGAYRTLEERRSIRIRWVELPLQPADESELLAAYAEVIGPRTRVIVVSHVSYVTGVKMPIAALAELAHRHGALLSVDGAHGLGMLPLDLPALACDHYAASGQKWLLAGPGSGLCYLSAAVRQQLWPLMGYRGAQQRGAAASAYEHHGQENLAAIAGLAAALQWQQRLVRAQIAARGCGLAQQLRDGLAGIDGVRLLTPRSAALNASITSFSVGEIAASRLADAVVRLAECYVIAMPVLGLNAVRVSTHVFNSRAEVERVLAAVSQIAANEFDYL